MKARASREIEAPVSCHSDLHIPSLHVTRGTIYRQIEAPTAYLLKLILVVIGNAKFVDPGVVPELLTWLSP